MKSIKITGFSSFSFFLFFSLNIYGQEVEKFNLTAGLGYPEAINVGVRYQMEQSQLGIFIGAFPGSDPSIFSAGADYYYHFAGSSALSGRKPWYGKAGLNYLHEKDEYDDNKYIMLVPRVGRDFNISPKIGIALEAGVLLVLHRNETELKPDPVDFLRAWYGYIDLLPPIFPSLGVTLFYRL